MCLPYFQVLVASQVARSYDNQIQIEEGTIQQGCATWMGISQAIESTTSHNSSLKT